MSAAKYFDTGSGKNRQTFNMSESAKYFDTGSGKNRQTFNMSESAKYFDRGSGRNRQTFNKYFDTVRVRHLICQLNILIEVAVRIVRHLICQSLLNILIQVAVGSGKYFESSDI